MEKKQVEVKFEKIVVSHYYWCTFSKSIEVMDDCYCGPEYPVKGRHLPITAITVEVKQ